MKKLIIIGARGFGREVCFTAKNSIGFEKEFQIKGFLDDHSNALSDYGEFPPILDSAENYHPHENDRFICALGNVEQKEKYVRMILEKGGRFMSLIDQSAHIAPTSNVGNGCIVMSGVKISTNIKIGDYVTIMTQTIIGHDVNVEDWCHISPFVFLGGGAMIEEKVQLHVRATVLPKLTIEKKGVIGAGSVVTQNTKADSTYFGNPAKNIGQFNNV